MNQEKIVKSYIKDILGFIFDREFLSKIKLTLLMIILYRLISFITIPGINLELIREDVTNNNFNNIFFTYLNKFSGGALKRMSVAFLGISPYITCSLFFSFSHHFSAYFASLKKEGALGRQKINDYTKLCAFIFAFFQGFFWSSYLQSRSDMNLVMFTGLFFSVQTAILCASATMIIIWFSDQISVRGIGSGSSIIIYASIVSLIPGAISSLLISFKNNEVSGLKLSIFLAFAFFLLFLVTFCERVYKTIKAQSLNNRKSFFQKLPENLVYMKLNPAGIYPAMFAGTLLSFPSGLDNLLHFSKYECGAWILSSLTPGSYFYIIFNALMIFCTSYIYAELIFNPEETAKRFKNDAVIAGRVPGKTTQDFLEEKLFYVATLGGVYLTLVCCLPELFVSKSNQSLVISGTSYIIIVGVAVDLIDKISAGVYSKFIEKSMKAIRKGYF